MCHCGVGIGGLSLRARLIHGLLALISMLWLITPTVAAETLVLCVEKTDVRPWRTLEGTGLNFDLLNRVGKQLDLVFEYKGLPWKRCLQDLKANKYVGAIGGSFVASRIEFGAYPGGDPADPSKRLNFDQYVLLRQKGGAVTWDGKTVNGLTGSVGIQLGYSVGEKLRALSIPVDDGSQTALELAQKLAAGRLGAAAMLVGEANLIMATSPKLQAGLEILPVPVLEKPYYLMLSHEFVNMRGPLAKRIWDTIEVVRNSNEYQDLEKQAFAASK